jgi:hypothetical protein
MTAVEIKKLRSSFEQQVPATTNLSQYSDNLVEEKLSEGISQNGPKIDREKFPEKFIEFLDKYNIDTYYSS